MRFASRLALPLTCLLLASCATSPREDEAHAVAKKARAHLLAGRAQLERRESAAAAVELEKCLALVPDQPACRWEMGWVHFTEYRWGQAIGIWDELVEQNRKKRIAELAGIDLSSALTKAKKLQEVQLEIDKAAKKAPRAPKPRKKKDRRVALTLRAGGDTMLGTDFPRNMLPPEVGQKPLEAMKPLLSEPDLAFLNYEGTLCDGGETDKCAPGSTRCYAFRTPTRFADYLKEAGVDLVSTANNHAADFGELCRAQTELALDRAGIAWSGRVDTFAVREVNGLTVALAAFHSADHVNSTLDVEAAADFVRSLKDQEGADIVIVSFHGGAEGFDALHVKNGPETFLGDERGDVIVFARSMVDAGASVVLGSGPHVPRAMEIYKNHLIAYSLGNFATYKTFNLSGFNSLGPLLEVGLDKRGRFVNGRIWATKQIGEGVPVPDEANRVVDLVRYLSETDFAKDGEFGGPGLAIARDGTILARKRMKRQRVPKRPEAPEAPEMPQMPRLIPASG